MAHAIPTLRADLPGAGRFQAVDVLRGTAIALMIAFHIGFDLVYFGVLRVDIYHDPFWVGARMFIVTLFLLTMGASLYLATCRGVRWPRFWRRVGFIAAGAGAVSIATWLVFPRSWIFFGVLHFIALASALALPFRRLYWSNLVLGVALVVLGVWAAHPFFDQPGLNWIGLVTRKPLTEDYVPLLPWFGVVLIGLWLGRVVYGRSALPAWAAGQRTGRLARTLAFAGRHGLLIYLVHQPILFGILWALLRPL
ncbi:MAG: heparan-alpha-glucosaminide N-acetyltransferase [Thiohalomonadaceae bacterium]